MNRVSIIVPFRDREAHLRQFVSHLVSFFRHDAVHRHLDVHITVVEQYDNLPFNIGTLKNIGFLETRDISDYFCFHDVDYLPVSADYSIPTSPTRAIWYGAERRPIGEGVELQIQHRYDTYFSGVVLFTQSDFEKVNGYANQYWGWGFEDVDLRIRCLVEGLPIVKRDGTFRALAHKHCGYRADLSLSEEGKRNKAVFERNLPALGGMKSYRRDGLSTVQYDVVGRERIADGKNHTITNLSVDLSNLRQVQVRREDHAFDWPEASSEADDQVITQK